MNASRWRRAVLLTVVVVLVVVGASYLHTRGTRGKAELRTIGDGLLKATGLSSTRLVGPFALETGDCIGDDHRLYSAHDGWSASQSYGAHDTGQPVNLHRTYTAAVDHLRATGWSVDEYTYATRPAAAEFVAYRGDSLVRYTGDEVAFQLRTGPCAERSRPLLSPPQVIAAHDAVMRNWPGTN
jgi:hypothetical protein